MADNFVDAIKAMKERMAQTGSDQSTAEKIADAQRKLIDALRTNPNKTLRKMTGNGKK